MGPQLSTLHYCYPCADKTKLEKERNGRVRVRVSGPHTLFSSPPFPQRLLEAEMEPYRGQGKRSFKCKMDVEEAEEEEEEEDDDDVSGLGFGSGDDMITSTMTRKKRSPAAMISTTTTTTTSSSPTSSGGSSSTRRSGSSAGGSSRPCSCQADNCNADLTESKHYHRRHKICEIHAKASVVIVAGIQQRFCQQCSRFHGLSEFDDTKRSCRRRLAGHNERRRKSSSDLHREGSN